MKVVYVFLLLTLFVVKTAIANDLENEMTADIRAYCQYVESKNNARKSLLMSPDLIVRAQNTNNDYPYQSNLITALSKDLADLGKMIKIKQLINDECHYYQLNQEANLQVQFALPAVQQKALRYKLHLIRKAKNKVKTFLHTAENNLKNHNDTVVSFYKIESYLEKMDAAEREIQVNLAIQQPPRIKTQALQQLIHDIGVAETKRQVTLNKLEKMNNWSLQVQAGAQHNSFTFRHNEDAQPYAALFLRYNLGSIDSNHKADQSLNTFGEWKNKQVNGTQKKLSRLILAVASLKLAEEERLTHLLASHKKYFGLRQTMGSLNSLKANKFKQQIEIDQILMDIEINYLKYFIQLLKNIV